MSQLKQLRAKYNIVSDCNETGYYCPTCKTWSTYKPPEYKCPRCHTRVIERDSPPFDPYMVIVYPAAGEGCEKEKVEK